MSAMFFGQFLLERGVIDRTQLLDAIDRQRQRNRTLPELAVHHGLFTAAVAEGVISAYRTVMAPIEELMMSVGGLTPDAVDRLKVMQHADWVRIGAALVEGRHLSEDLVAHHLEEFHALEREVEDDLKQEVESLPSPLVVETCVRLAIHHVSRLIDCKTKLSRLQMVPRFPPIDGRRRSLQRISGDIAFTMAIDMPPEMASLAARRLVGTRLPEGSEVEADALREVVNLVGGHACTRLESSGLRLWPEPPRSQDHLEPPTRPRSIVHAKVIAEESPFDVLLGLE